MSGATPVLVGVGQVLQREDEPDRIREPMALMIEALEKAADDAGSRALLARAQAVRVVRGAWRYEDPGRVIAQRLGCPTAQTAITPFGGNFVQTAINRTCLDIQSGALEVALLTGAECGRGYFRLRRAGRDLPYSDAPGAPDLEIGKLTPPFHEAELACDIKMPIQVYPMFENALRHERGESIEAHRTRIATLWAGFSQVAAGNPNAWIRKAYTAEEIATPGPHNRPVSFPYPMLMNSNSRVDMGAALILTSETTARALGIPQEKLVYPYAGTDAHDPIFVSERRDFHTSPAIRLAGRRCLEMAGVEARDLDHRDVYSCFPSAVQVAAAELDLDLEGPLTVTGGLTFGGGPLNNYVMHGVARMAEVLRADPGTRGLCTANGGYLTKHAFGVYSTEPPERPFRHADLQAEVDAVPGREVATDASGPVTVESYTVMYEGETPTLGHVACRLPDGRRAWGNVPDQDTAAAMTRDEFCGKPARLQDGVVSF